MENAAPPASVIELIDDFALLVPGDRLQALIEAGVDAPDLPDHVLARRDEMEPVRECSSPVFLLVDVVDEEVLIYVDAPAQAPTTRGYATLLMESYSGATPTQVLALPPDLPEQLGLGEVISPRRLAGMHGLGARIRRQVARALGQDAPVGDDEDDA